MILHGYWRSSAAYRVRIALNLKGIEWTHRGVSLVRDGGEQRQPAFEALNPQMLVPVLESGSKVLTQSMAIIEYLEDLVPDPPLLPDDVIERAHVRALAMSIACDVHPLNNLRVLQYLGRELQIGAECRSRWYAHWVSEGLRAFEASLARASHSWEFCHGDRPTLADVCLIPQIYNAKRIDIDLSSFPLISQVEANCSRLKAFVDAKPELQPDAN